MANGWEGRHASEAAGLAEGVLEGKPLHTDSPFYPWKIDMLKKWKQKAGKGNS